MKAFVLTGIRAMEMREVPTPAIVNADDVLIRMKSIGVCGSDVHYYETGRIGSQVVQYPFTVGHECAGVVEAVGSGVSRMAPGSRVAVDPAIYCGSCDQCRVGRRHTCRKLRFLGCPGQVAGCLSEYIVMPEKCLFPIGEAMTLDQAALAEPLSIGVYAVKQSIPMKSADIGILGAGPIGLSVLLPARAQGARTVHVTDKIDARLNLSRRMGADTTANPDKQDAVKEILAHTPAGLDAVFECCGEQDALDQAIDLLKPGGVLMLIGIPRVDRVSFSIDSMRRKEIRVQNVRRQEGCVQAALDMIDSRAANVDPLLTHRFPFEGTKEAFDLVARYADGVLKAVIEM
jgi:L-iditol 2-dehydrogenase